MSSPERSQVLITVVKNEEDGDQENPSHGLSCVHESPSSVKITPGTKSERPAVVKLDVKVKEDQTKTNDKQNNRLSPTDSELKDIFAEVKQLLHDQRHLMRHWKSANFGPGDVHPTVTYVSVDVKAPVHSRNTGTILRQQYPSGNESDLLDESDQFLKALYQNIKDTSRHELALDQLKRLQEKMKDEKAIPKQVNAFFAMQPEKMTLLELVANYEQPGGKQKLISLVLQLFPELLSQERVSNTTPTALHILVYNRNLEGAKRVTESAEAERQLDKLLLAQVIDKKYEKTRMMGEIALFIAALSFDYEMVEFFIGKGTKVSTIVSGGNTVFHLLVKYAALYPEHQTDVRIMMEELNKALRNEGKENTSFQSEGKEKAAFQSEGKENTAFQNEGKEKAAFQSEGKENTAFQSEGKVNTAFQSEGKENTAFQNEGKEKAAFQSEGKENTAFQSEGKENTAFQSEGKEKAAFQSEGKENTAFQSEGKVNTAFQSEGKENTAFQNEGKEKAAFQSEGKENAAFQSEGKENTAFQNEGKEKAAFQSEGKEKAAFQSEGKENTAFQSEGKENTAFQNEGKEKAAFQSEGKEKAAFQSEGKENTAFQSEGKENTAFQNEGKEKAAFQNEGKEKAAFQSEGKENTASQSERNVDKVSKTEEPVNISRQNERKVDTASQSEEKVNTNLLKEDKVHEEKGKEKLSSLWYKTNDEGQTVLQLAALKEQYEIFDWMLQLEDIYLKNDKIDNLIDCVRFDVNEIDYVALYHFRSLRSGSTKQGKSNPGNLKPGNSNLGNPKPGNLKPGNSNPGNLKPGNIKPGNSNPGNPKPGNIKPGNSNPRNTIQGKSNSGKIIPGSRPNAVNPTSNDPKETTSLPSTSKQDHNSDASFVSENACKTKETDNGGSSPTSTLENSSCSLENIYSPSVIEIICEKIETKKALQFIKMSLFDAIIDTKWEMYKWWFGCWLILHIVSLALIPIQAWVKAQLINGTNDTQQLMSTIIAYTLGTLLFAIGLMYLVVVGISVYHRSLKRVFTDRRNVGYHVLLVVYSFFLMIDALWFWVRGTQDSYFLALALVVGSWFLQFFLRPFKPFSVLTTMLISALLEGLRFAIIILFDFVAFSLAIFILDLTTPDKPPDDPKHLGTSVLTMFKLMVGMDDLEILKDEPSQGLKVTLLIIFIVLTFILTLNILIAIMTNACSEMSENRELQWKLQRLAVVVMIEKMLPLCYACNSAEDKDEESGRFLSKRFYFEKQTHRIFKERNQQLKKDKNSDDTSDPTTIVPTSDAKSQENPLPIIADSAGMRMNKN